MNTIEIELPDAEATRDFGARLAAVLRPGDLVLLSGGLGAGKTTLTQGIGAGLNVRGHVASPTFIIARVHHSLVEGPDLVHVDAYRLSSLDELDALDLDSSLEESVTVVEWGAGTAEALSADRLEVELQRPEGAATPGVGGEAEVVDAPIDLEDLAAPAGRRATVRAVGSRWRDLDAADLQS